LQACLFGAIADRSEPTDLVYEDDSVICCLPQVLNAYGYMLIAPGVPYETLWISRTSPSFAVTSAKSDQSHSP
jgi:hypothetical protein